MSGPPCSDETQLHTVGTGISSTSGNPYNSTSKEDALKFINSVKVGDKIQLVSGINKDNIHAPNVEYADYLPNNMAVNRLMLPGFPKQSLSDFYNTLTEDEKKYVNPTGKAHKFSNDKYRPYVDSLNIDKIGLRSSSQFFDTDDKTNGVIEIYPTIEEMVVNGVRVDEINEGVTPDDDGRFEDNATVANVDIYLSPSIDFDINDLREDDFSISMKDGMCGGRTFKVASVLKENGRWRLRIERVKDEALELWFPYKDYPIRKGDHFVLTGIKLPDSYVRAASLKLLKYAIALLDKNDYTRYVYQPKVDEIFMARQHDMALSDTTGLVKSLHDTLKAGDLLRFEDTDLGIDAEITIDQLVIKEAEGQIPTYDEEVDYDVWKYFIDGEIPNTEVDKLQNQISSLLSGNAGTGGGLTIAQLRAEIASEGGKRFLSKLKDDTAQGLITFLKGLKSQDVIKAINGFKLGNDGDFSIDGAGRAVLSEVAVSLLKSLNYNNAEQTGFAIEQKNGKYQMSITDLIVWGKAIFNTLQLRELSYVGGNIVLSPSASKLTHVVEIRNNDGEITGWKCYLLADDGSTATINSWKVDDQARCQTFNIKTGVYENVGNKDYWRRVTEVSQDNEVITDGNGHELYDGNKFAWIILSKTDCSEGADAVVNKNNSPAAGDSLVLIGNRTDKSRQNMLLLETEGSEAPRFVMYRGINNYSLANRSIVSVNYNGINIRTGYIHYSSPSGDTIWAPCYRGDWKEGTEYSYYDEVTWLGTRWLCIVPEGDTTITEPSEDNDYWRATTAIFSIKLALYHDLAAGICKGETHTVECRLMLGDKDVTSAVKSWAASRKTDDAADDIAWALKDKVKNFKGSIDITWANDNSEDDLGRGDVASFTFTAITNTGDVHKATLEL